MTAEVIGKAFDIDIIKDAKLREHNNGDAAFKTKTWAEENKNHFSQNELIDNPLWVNAETFRDLFNRITQFKEAYLVDLKEDLVIVSHGVAIGYLVMSFLGLKAENLVNASIRGNAGGISILSKSLFLQNTLNKYNSTNHLNLIEI